MPYGRLWPAHPKPLEDELLSSWWVRLARANHERLHSFTRLCLPGSSVWNRDIDRSVSRTALRVLARKTGTRLDWVEATTLRAFEGRLFARFNKKTNTRWVLPLGVYHRTHRGFGLQFCPECLRSDRVPYFRRAWRLAFVTVCPHHWSVLRDRCPHCGAAVAFHRLEFGGRRGELPEHAITTCQRCGLDICDGTGSSEAHLLPIRARPAASLSAGRQRRSRRSVNLTRLGYLQRWLLEGLEAGSFNLGELEPFGLRAARGVRRTSKKEPLEHRVSALEFFDVLRVVVNILATDCGDRGYPARAPQWSGKPPDRRRVQFCKLVRERVGVRKTVTGEARRGVGFEYLPVEDRWAVMAMTAYAMTDWPRRFVALCRGSGLTISRLTRDLQNIGVSAWFLEILRSI
jgi:hypothetical protein